MHGVLTNWTRPELVHAPNKPGQTSRFGPIFKTIRCANVLLPPDFLDHNFI